MNAPRQHTPLALFAVPAADNPGGPARTRRTREEWKAELAEHPVTPNQLGRLHREFARLGYRPADRDARLATCAALLGLDDLATMKDLRQGQAGQLVGMLGHDR
jgi:hypothetical protein